MKNIYSQIGTFHNFPEIQNVLTGIIKYTRKYIM